MTIPQHAYSTIVAMYIREYYACRYDAGYVHMYVCYSYIYV